MKTFLGMEVEQTARLVKIHLHHFVKGVMAEHAENIKAGIRPKKLPISPNVILKPNDTPELPDPRKQKFYRSFVAKVQFAATWDDSILLSQYLGWPSPVHQLDLRNG